MLKKYGLPILFGVMAVIAIVGMVNNFPKKSARTYLPVLAYQSQEGGFGVWSTSWLTTYLPVFSYPAGNNIIAQRQDSFLLEKIKPVELLTMMEFENTEELTLEDLEQLADGEADVLNTGEEAVLEMVAESDNTTEPSNRDTTEDKAVSSAFVPHTLQNIVNLQELSDYETLLQKFYTVDNVAMVGSDLLHAETLNSMDLRISKDTDGPQILIYHTHSQEAFADSVQGDESTTIVGVGAHLAEILQNEYGYNVLHHQGKYDVESRDNAYSRALPEIEKILEENPTIQVVIDLHRDGIADESNKLVMDLDGRPTAKFMFFNGVSCGKKTGSIDYLYNPNLNTNLAFSFQMKKAAEEYYPGLTRKNYINAYRYNMHLCGRTTLLELGAQNNTVEEAMNACDPIAHILDMVLTGA